MRPFITFIGLILLIPGWTLFTANFSDIRDPHFSTSSGKLLWTLMGNPHDVGLFHHYGLGIIILGIMIAVVGLLTTHGEKENTSFSIP